MWPRNVSCKHLCISTFTTFLAQPTSTYTHNIQVDALSGHFLRCQVSSRTIDATHPLLRHHLALFQLNQHIALARDCITMRNDYSSTACKLSLHHAMHDRVCLIVHSARRLVQHFQT